MVEHPQSVTLTGVYKMLAAIAPSPLVAPVATKLGVAREIDARCEASPLARRISAYFGAVVEVYDPLSSERGRRGYLDEGSPPRIHLASLGGVTNYAVAAFVLGEWVERMFFRLVGSTDVYSEAGERLTAEHSSTFRLSPKALGKQGAESGFTADHAGFFQGFAALILLGMDCDRLFCELIVRAIEAPASDTMRLLHRISETTTLVHQHALREYAQANLTFAEGPAHTTRNIVSCTLLASFLADHAINRQTALIGLD